LPAETFVKLKPRGVSEDELEIFGPSCSLSFSIFIIATWKLHVVTREMISERLDLSPATSKSQEKVTGVQLTSGSLNRSKDTLRLDESLLQFGSFVASQDDALRYENDLNHQSISPT
jgi:hypothetical protein